jgi:hypothetical protein
LNHAFNGFQPPLSAQSSAAPAATATGTSNTAENITSPTVGEVRPEIESGQSLDPQGAAKGDTKGEHPETATRAYDGAPDTAWETRYYSTPNFSGIKGGVGYAITLVQPAKVTSIVLSTNNTGGNVEVRATTPDKPTEGEILASGPLAPETDLTFAQPTESQTFVLWFNELPTSSIDGKLRVSIKEILVS